MVGLNISLHAFGLGDFELQLESLTQSINLTDARICQSLQADGEILRYQLPSAGLPLMKKKEPGSSVCEGVYLWRRP